MQSGQVPVRIESSDHLGLSDGVIMPVQHILFTGPDQLHGRARHLLGDQDRLTDVIVACGAPAEAAAEVVAVDIAFVDRQARGRNCCGESSLGILRCRPDLAFLIGPQSRGVHRLHGGMVLVWETVVGFHFLGCTRDGCFDVTRLVADEGLLRRQSFLEHLIDALAGECGIRPPVPFDG